MVYVIIGVALLFILVPFLSVLPTPRQRAQMKMRNAARAAGVTVELKTIPDPNPDQDKYISHIGKSLPTDLRVAAYRCQRRRANDWRQLPKVDWCMQKIKDEGWQWVQPVNEHLSSELKSWLDDAVPKLPADVEQVEERGYNIVVYWHERTPGDEQRVFDFLSECASLVLCEPSDEEDI